MVRLLSVGVSLMMGIAVTFSLFFLMQFLIAGGDYQPERSERRIIGDITIPEIQLEVQRVAPKPQEPEAPEEVPDLPEPQFDISAPSGPGIALATNVQIDTGGLDATASISASDADYLPIVTIAPQYPQRALQRGIEGWCLVSFTVNENGGVEDPVVVDADPPNIFDSSSLRAVTRFKFNPKMENGKPVRTTGVQYVFRYNLDDA